MRPGVFDGGATYTLNVLRHLPKHLDEAHIVVYCRTGETRLEDVPNLELRRVQVGTPVTRILFETTALSSARADVLISPNESLPVRLSCPTVVVAQNLAYHCERSTVRFGGGSVRDRVLATAQRAYYRRRMPSAYRRAAVVVPISDTAAQLLAREASLPLDRAVVARGGSDSVFVIPPRDAARVDDRLLIVSAVAPYKNFDAVVDLVARLRPERPNLRVDVAGGDWRGYASRVEALARRAGVADALRFLGPLAPAEVAARYAEASLLLHLSECEACPLPPLEAMRAGLPVVAARRSSIPEIVGDGALLVDPDDRPGLARAVDELLASAAARDALRVRGRARAAELTWDRTAAGIAAAVRRAAAYRR